MIKEVHTNKECIEAIKKAKPGETIFFKELEKTLKDNKPKTRGGN